MHFLIPEFFEFAPTKLKYLPTSQLHIPKRKVKNLRIGYHFLGGSTVELRLAYTKNTAKRYTDRKERDNKLRRSSWWNLS